MFVAVINDCRDSNAFARQLTRAAVLFNQPVIPIGVTNEIEAAGNLIDVLDAAEDGEGVILLNVAPRHGKAKKWPNGTPFCYFRVNNVLIVASIDGYSLSLIKKLDLVTTVQVLDIPTVIAKAVTDGYLGKMLGERIIHTQFRSFEFVPRVAHWILQGKDIPSTNSPISDVADVPGTLWFVDNFGNCKTTMLPEEIGFQAGKAIKTRFGEIHCYDRLKDVPNDTPALIIGSSGYQEKRFVEFIVQGKSAAHQFSITVGDQILNS